jgi:hypothetical protein
LHGIAARLRAGASPPVRIAAGVLADLGAAVSAVPGRADELCAHRPGGAGVRVALRGEQVAVAGLPPATVDYALGLCLVIATCAAVLSGDDHEVIAEAVAAQLLLPQLLAASHGAPPPPPPAAPVRTADGSLWCDRRDDEARALFAALLGDRPPERWAAAELAALAQSVGLPALAFRPRARRGPHAWVVRAAGERGPSGGVAAPTGRTAPLAGTRVLDLTTMWSGPLATWLLAALGADVVKVEPACRLDGTRGLDGAAVYPGGRFVAGDPDRSAIFAALNRGKRRLDADLREPVQRRAFQDELDGGELVIANMTPRALRNLGLTPAALRRSRPLAHVAMPAFPGASAQRDWRAYGHGIHAASGLGLTADGRPWVAAAPYCDALSGFAAAAVATALRVAPRRHWRAEVPMLGVAARLARLAPPAPAPPVHDEGAAARFLHDHGERALSGGLPRSPFAGPGLPVADAPAPAGGRR